MLLEPFIGRAGHRTRVIVTHDIDYGLEQADIALGLKHGKTQWLQPADRVSSEEARSLYK
jgi:ABC-type phosphate/phosphonate transport system ATPase subunit